MMIESDIESDEEDLAILANDAQKRASTPSLNVWTTANAGSGKTSVLVDRFLRLLLSGNDPSKILCITYTKAAAVEMVERVRDSLGKWSLMDESELKKQLTQLNVQIDDNTISLARGLFLKVLDTPGGLKISTFHSFCQSVLGRFPLEAGVSPSFDILAEVGTLNLNSKFAEDIFEIDDPTLRESISYLSLRIEDEDFFRLIQSIHEKHHMFEELIGYDSSSRQKNYKNFISTIWDKLQVPRDQTKLKEQLISINEDEDLIAAVVKISKLGLAKSSKTSEKLVTLSINWLESDSDARLELGQEWEALLLTKEGSRSKNTEKALSKILEEEEREKCYYYLCDYPKRCRSRYDIGRDSEAVIVLSRVVLDLYEKYKSNRGLLDYDDLITRVRDLLGESGSDQASWVHFKLDGGIDHVLVDEAQDTDRVQWAILEALVYEFYVGKSASDERREDKRTLFVVGDPKQSIFGFRGTDPKAMNESYIRLGEMSGNVGVAIKNVELNVSFRSTEEVLSFVDKVYEVIGVDKMGIQGEEKLEHKSFRTSSRGDKGFVLMLPLAKTPSDSDDADSDDDRVYSGQEYIAEVVVDYISSLLGRWRVPSTGELLKTDDVLILCRKRKTLFKAAMRAFQRRGIAVSTRSDENLRENIAVSDIFDLLEVLLSPDDDYRLACVLKTPFVGWDEENVFRICYNRQNDSVWGNLRKLAESEEKSRIVYEWIENLKSRVDIDSPYQLLNRILYGSCPCGFGDEKLTGYQAMVGRLGVEAKESIEILLMKLRDFERDNTNSLRNFLDEMRKSELKVKKGSDSKDAVRLMTMHGAKGLEAPLVVVLETLGGGKPDEGKYNMWQDKDMLWFARPRDIYSAEIEDAQDIVEQEKKLDEQEQARLMYVALTRARDALIICGAYNKRKMKDDWYSYLRSGMDNIGGREIQIANTVFSKRGMDHWEEDSYRIWGQEPILEQREISYGEGIEEEEETDSKETECQNLWYKQPFVIEDKDKQEIETYQASKLQDGVVSGGDVGLTEDKDLAINRGLLVHRLFEVLSKVGAEQRLTLGRKVLQLEGRDFAKGGEGEELLNGVLKLMESPRFRHLFERGYAEVGIGGVVSHEGSDVFVNGRVDRLLVGEDEVVIIDYKTSKSPKQGKVPEVYIKQMSSYAMLLKNLWRDKQIRGLILWTRDMSISELKQKDLGIL